MKHRLSPLELWILEKFVSKRVWGTYHISEDDVHKGAPKRLRTQRRFRKEVKVAIKNLVKLGFMVSFPHRGTMHYHLNPRMRKEIMESVC